MWTGGGGDVVSVWISYHGDGCGEVSLPILCRITTLCIISGEEKCGGNEINAI